MTDILKVIHTHSIEGHWSKNGLVTFVKKNNMMSEIRLPMRLWQNICSVNAILFIRFNCLNYHYESGNLQRPQHLRSSNCVLCKYCCLLERIMEKMRLTR